MVLKRSIQRSDDELWSWETDVRVRYLRHAASGTALLQWQVEATVGGI